MIMLFPTDGKTPNMKQRAELIDCKPWDPIHSGAVTPIFFSLEDTFFTFSLLSKRVSRQSLWISSQRHFPSPPAGQGEAAHFPRMLGETVHVLCCYGGWLWRLFLRTFFFSLGSDAEHSQSVTSHLEKIFGFFLLNLETLCTCSAG